MAVIGKFVVTIVLLVCGSVLVVLVDYYWIGINLNSFSKIQIGVHEMVWMLWGIIIWELTKKLWFLSQ